jgi:ATP-dependent Lhr-like helicase
MKSKVAGFYAARSRTIPPLPWPTFAPPFSLRASELEVEINDGILEVTASKDSCGIEQTLAALANGAMASPADLAGDHATLIVEKFHQYLSIDLLLADAFASRLNFSCLVPLAKMLLQSQPVSD